jgi:putative membrane protein
MVGGHFTYAEVPLPNLFGNLFGEGRNNFDKLGHFAQGFIPAIITRELLIRKNIVSTKTWLNFMIISICLSFSAMYELIEWCVAVLSGEGADAFLGTQGYVWDTQTDMFMALIGAIISLLILSKLHDNQLEKI